MSPLELPQHLLMAILNKMKTKALVRMRCTCKAIDILVEKYRKEFASRPHLGIMMRISSSSWSRRKEFSFYVSEPNWIRRIARTNIFDDTFSKKMSGISVYRIKLGSLSNSEIPLLTGIFKEWKPMCCDFYIADTIPLESFVSITDQISFICKNLSNDNLRCYFNRQNWETTLAVLSTAKNRSLFRICRPHDIITNQLFNKIQYFSHVQFRSSVTGFSEMLWDIYNSTNEPQMSSIAVSIDKDTPPFCPDRTIPPFQTLRNPTKMKRKPYDIRFISLHSHLVLIFESGSYGNNIYSLLFTRKSCDAVLQTMLDVYKNRLNEELREELRSIASSIFN